MGLKSEHMMTRPWTSTLPPLSKIPESGVNRRVSGEWRRGDHAVQAILVVKHAFLLVYLYNHYTERRISYSPDLPPLCCLIVKRWVPGASALLRSICVDCPSTAAFRSTLSSRARTVTPASNGVLMTSSAVH